MKDDFYEQHIKNIPVSNENECKMDLLSNIIKNSTVVKEKSFGQFIPFNNRIETHPTFRFTTNFLPKPWYLNQFNDDSEATRHENVCFRRYQIKDDNALVGNTINLTGYSMAFDPVVMVRAEIEFEKKKISINYSFIIGKNRNLRTEDSFYPVTTYKCVKYKEILTFDGESIKSISSYDPDHILASKLTLGRMFDENSELNMVPHKQAQALLDALLKTKDYFESLNKKTELNTAPKQENSKTHTELPNEK